jgi:Ciliary basal body-associated, B9 protein
VHISGTVHLGTGFNVTSAFCTWEILIGNEWSKKSGSINGKSHTAITNSVCKSTYSYKMSFTTLLLKKNYIPIII